MKENMVERHPMKNYLKPEEVAEMADFLISEKAKSISGQVLKWIMVSFHLSFKTKYNPNHDQRPAQFIRLFDT
jgi:hypothetical protein